MKQIIFFLILACLTTALKAQSVKPKFSYKQIMFLDSLRNARKRSTVTINPTPLLVYNSPVNLLPNEDEKWGMSGEDTIYRMKTDNILLLKPNKNTTRIPNAAEGKIFMVPPVIKKP